MSKLAAGGGGEHDCFPLGRWPNPTPKGANTKAGLLSPDLQVKEGETHQAPSILWSPGLRKLVFPVVRMNTTGCRLPLMPLEVQKLLLEVR